MSTATTNLGLTKPTPGDPADRNVWGTTLNGNLDALDGIFAGAGTGTSVGLKVGSGKTLAVAGTLALSGVITGTLHWNASSQIGNVSDGVLSLQNNAATNGVSFDFSAGSLKVRNAGNTADASIAAASGQFSGPISSVDGRYLANSASCLYLATGDGKATLSNNARTIGVQWDVTTTGVLQVKNLAGSADASITHKTETAGDNTNKSATTAFVTAAVAAAPYAPLASPAFTGNPTAPTATAGDNDTSIATTAFVQSALSSAGALTGEIKMYGGATAPTGWYLCDGSAKNTTTDAALFAVTGYAFGGSGTSFNVPDFRGRSAFGVDNMGGTAANRLGSGATGGVTGTASLGATGGEQKHTLTATEQASMPVSGTFSGSGTTPVNFSGGGSAAPTMGGAVEGTSPVTVSGSISGTASGGGTAFNVTPPALVVTFIIKK